MRVVVLEYHDVVDGDVEASGFRGAAAASYKLDATTFERHLDRVATAGVRLGGSVRDVAAESRAGTPVLFTFDDGGVSAHKVIAPRLERRGWLAHVLVTTDRIGTSGFLTPAQIKDLHQRGHVIGSHSASHPVRMSHCKPDELRREWTTSVAVLSDLVGSEVDVASVPGGYLSDAVVRAAAAAGIRYLFTSEPESRVRVIDGCNVFGRFTLRRSSSPADAARLVSRNPVGRFNQWAVWSAKKVVKRVGGRFYLRTRSALLERGPSEDAPPRVDRP